MTKFSCQHFSLVYVIGVSACRKTPLGTLKVSQGTFSDTLIRLEAFKKILFFSSKNRLFSQGDQWFVAKKDQTFKSAFVGFTLQAKLVSSKHLIQVHLKISSRTLENLASHLVTKCTLEAQAVNHLSR